MIRVVRCRSFSAFVGMCLVAGLPGPAHAYLKLGMEIDGRSVPLHWADLPVRYYVRDTNIPNDEDHPGAGIAAGQHTQRHREAD